MQKQKQGKVNPMNEIFGELNKLRQSDFTFSKESFFDSDLKSIKNTTGVFILFDNLGQALRVSNVKNIKRIIRNYWSGHSNATKNYFGKIEYCVAWYFKNSKEANTFHDKLVAKYNPMFQFKSKYSQDEILESEAIMNNKTKKKSVVVNKAKDVKEDNIDLKHNLITNQYELTLEGQTMILGENEAEIFGKKLSEHLTK